MFLSLALIYCHIPFNYVGTFRAVMRNVATGFQRVAVCLEHHGGTVVSDSWSHHCWAFPPDNWVHPRGGGESKTVGDCVMRNNPAVMIWSEILVNWTVQSTSVL